MFYTPELIANDANVAAHWDQEWVKRNGFAAVDQQMLRSYNLNTNASILTKDFWRATDNVILELRNQETGMEIVNDLLTVQTTLSIGYTVKTYNVVGDIADDVAVSMDGQAPYSFDHVDYATDGDPIPIITAGFGVNWRKQVGLQNVNIDLVRDSQSAKQREYNKKLVAHILDGNAKIVVDGKPSQGLRTHRNTKKIDLDASGANIDLTTASAAQILAFFQGTFAPLMTANRVTAIDVLWVSYEIYQNMSKSVFENGQNVGLAYDYLLKNFARIKSIRPTFALSGNEFIGYVRDRSYVSPLVGMPTGVVALPRPMPQSNYNFQIMGAMGLQITADSAGMSGVFYGANIT